MQCTAIDYTDLRAGDHFTVGRYALRATVDPEPTPLRGPGAPVELLVFAVDVATGDPVHLVVTAADAVTR